MGDTASGAILVSPRAVLKAVAAAVPTAVHPNMIVIGSLAAGYWLFSDDASFGVRTKDVDCVLSPHIEAVNKGRAVAEKLLNAGWRPKQDGHFGKPGHSRTPDKDLPAVRLYPPAGGEWFIELLAEPAPETQQPPQWTRLALSSGHHYALPSFPFTGIATFEAQLTEFGIRCAQPMMMALANLLEHPSVRPETMSGLIAGRRIKRSNKDLGRVLAISLLSVRRDDDALLAWSTQWRRALQGRFQQHWRELARQAGSGLRQLVSQPNDLEEARHTCASGLLASMPPTQKQLEIMARRLLVDAIEPLEGFANQ